MFGGDLRYALRSMRLKPGFTAIAAASLALGIGANTAIFSLVDQLLLWSVPARDPEQLVRIEGGYADAYPFYREYRDRNQVFSALFAGSRPYPAGIRPEGAAAVEVGHVHFVSGNYFPALGIGAAAGRVIAGPDDAAPGSGPIAVLSYAYWQSRFAGDPKVIGRKLAVNGFPLQIAGIAEKGFGGIYNGQQADLFVPLTMFPVTNPAAARAWNTPNMFWLTSMARLKPGISVKQAQAAMQVLWPQAAEAVNTAALKAGGRRRKFREQQITLQPGASDPASARKEMTDPLRVLSIATCLVLLIACANVANLLLSRATGRRREIAVRLAMGATRGRLIAQLLVESLVLAVVGGAVGLLCAWWGVSAMASASILSPDLHFSPSLKVLAFSAGVTLLTGVLFGLAPAFRATRLSLAESIKDGGAAGQGASRMFLAKALVAGQVALSLALLVGAGLFVRTLRNLQNVDVGFDRENVLVADIDPTNLGYRGHRLRMFYDQLLEHAAALPGVRSASLSTVTPMGMYSMSYSFSAEGYQPKPGERMVGLVNPVSHGYFTTLGISMLLGRDFRPEDQPATTPGDSLMASIGRASGSTNDTPANASRVCIIDEQMARRFFGGANPVGKHISYNDRYSAENALEIVGVVKNAHYFRIKTTDSEGTFYIPTWSNGAEARFLELRTGNGPAGVAAALRREVRKLDPNIPVLRTSTIEEDFNRNLSRERMIAFLSGFFGLLALGLASVGLYGVMSYAVTGRTREVGIRMALGARRSEVVAMIVRESLQPVLIGMAIGVGAALAVTRLAAGLLFGVAPRDPLSIILAAAAMLTVALLAAALPARRASRVEPITALRYE
jgi:putative ABC transport system permease protein